MNNKKHQHKQKTNNTKPKGCSQHLGCSHFGSSQCCDQNPHPYFVACSTYAKPMSTLLLLVFSRFLLLPKGICTWEKKDGYIVKYTKTEKSLTNNFIQTQSSSSQYDDPVRGPESSLKPFMLDIKPSANNPNPQISKVSSTKYLVARKQALQGKIHPRPPKHNY